MGANCGDTYRVLKSHDTMDHESDGGLETYFKPLLDRAKVACGVPRRASWKPPRTTACGTRSERPQALACEQFPDDDAVRRSLYDGEGEQDIEAKLHRFDAVGPRNGQSSYMHPHLDRPGTSRAVYILDETVKRDVICAQVVGPPRVDGRDGQICFL